MKIFIFLISILSPFTIVIAQVEQENNLPQLNNHYFIPNSNTASPFIKSYFEMGLGIAASENFENVIFEIDGENILGLKGSLIFCGFKF